MIEQQEEGYFGDIISNVIGNIEIDVISNADNKSYKKMIKRRAKEHKNIIISSFTENSQEKDKATEKATEAVANFHKVG